MKIVLAGGFGIGDSLESVYRAAEVLGHDLRHVPTRRIKNESGELKAALEVAKAVEGAGEQGNRRAEALLWWNPKEDICRGFVEELRKKEPNLKTVYWTIDDPHFLLKANPPWLGEFEYILTSCEESREEYERRGQKAFTFWPAVDPWRHRHRFDAALECNFVLAMTNCYAKDEFPDLVFDRRDLARALQAKFGGVHLYGKWDGYGWGSEKGCPELKECYKGWRSHAELVPVFSSARISVNAHGYTKHKGYLNERNFEILGSGGFLLVDRVAGIEEIFQEGRHCVFYDSLDDLLEKAAWYLEHEGERKRIAYEGMVYAHANFNALDWVRRLEGVVKS